MKQKVVVFCILSFNTKKDKVTCYRKITCWFYENYLEKLTTIFFYLYSQIVHNILILRYYNSNIIDYFIITNRRSYC